MGNSTRAHLQNLWPQYKKSVLLHEANTVLVHNYLQVNLVKVGSCRSALLPVASIQSLSEKQKKPPTS